MKQELRKYLENEKYPYKTRKLKQNATSRYRERKVAEQLTAMKSYFTALYA